MACGENSEIGLTISVFVARPRQRRLKKVAIAKSLRAAEQRELLAVDVDHEVHAEPYRLIHFAQTIILLAL